MNSCKMYKEVPPHWPTSCEIEHPGLVQYLSNVKKQKINPTTFMTQGEISRLLLFYLSVVASCVAVLVVNCKPDIVVFSHPQCKF